MTKGSFSPDPVRHGTVLHGAGSGVKEYEHFQTETENASFQLGNDSIIRSRCGVTVIVLVPLYITVKKT